MKRPMVRRSAAKSPESKPTRPQQLEAIRQRLTAALADASPRELAVVSRELRDTLREIESLPAEKGSALDELTARRTAAARKSAAAGS